MAERQLYDNRVVVKFNSEAYANSANIVEWLDQQLIPVLNNEPTLLALDMFSGHQTEEVLDTLTAHDITVSNIPGGCTSLLQPLDVSINKPFKDILKVSLLPNFGLPPYPIARPSPLLFSFAPKPSPISLSIICKLTIQNQIGSFGREGRPDGG